MAMTLSERIECVPTSSGANPSLAVPTCLYSALMTVMMLEALAERRPCGGWIVSNRSGEIASLLSQLK